MKDFDFISANTKPVPKTWHDQLGRKCHFILEVSDNGTNLVTFKYWRQRKARWEYGIIQKTMLHYHRYLEKSFKNFKENS